MRVTFLAHDGFLIELDSVCLLFDWWKGALPPLPDKPAELPPVYVVSSPEETELRALIREMEGNRQLMAEKLGISRSTLWRRLKKYGLE